MFQASNKIDDFSKTKVDVCMNITPWWWHLQLEKNTVKFLHEQVKSKFTVCIENNNLSHESVKLKSSDWCAKNIFLLDPKAKAWKPEFEIWRILSIVCFYWFLYSVLLAFILTIEP